MKEVIYTFTELEFEASCDFCPKIPDGKNAVYRLTTRNTKTNRLLSSDGVCEDCKLKIDSNQLDKCPDCGRNYRRVDYSWFSIEPECGCTKRDAKFKTPIIETNHALLEKQLHNLTIEKAQTEEELETEREAHLAGVDATANWYKREHEKETNDLKDKIKVLECQVKHYKERRLSDENRTLKNKVDVLESKLGSLNLENRILRDSISVIKSEINQLDTKLETQIEQPPK